MPCARARGRANLYCDDDAFARSAACLCIAETDRVVRTRTEDLPQVQRRSGDPRRAKVELQFKTRFFLRVPRVLRGGELVSASVILKTPSWRSSTQHHVLHYTAMIDVQTGLFTVAVFQDVAWAQKGLDALKQAGFPSESLTILAKESPEVGKF